MKRFFDPNHLSPETLLKVTISSILGTVVFSIVAIVFQFVDGYLANENTSVVFLSFIYVFWILAAICLLLFIATRIVSRKSLNTNEASSNRED